MDPIRVLLFGTSFGARVHAPGFLGDPGYELVGIAGADAAKARRVADELGIRSASGDWSALLRETAPELVSIAGPVDLHHPMMMAALDAGAHVLCEKPTALDRAQAAAMRDRAAALGRVAAMNHEFRFLPARAWAVEMARRGAIGPLRRGEIVGRYATWATPAIRGMTWLSDRARGGGILGALGSHHTDCLRQFFGEPRSVLATVRVVQPLRGEGAEQARATADDAFTLDLEFGSGTAIVDVNASVPYRWERFEIHGDDGTLRWDEPGERLWRIVAGRDPEEIPIPDTLRLTRAEGEPHLLAPFRVLLGRLRAAIREGTPMAPNFDDAVAVQSVLDAARTSSDRGARIAVEAPARLASAPA